MLKIGDRWRALLPEREIFSRRLTEVRGSVVMGKGKQVTEAAHEPLFRKACTEFLERLDSKKDRKEIRKLLAYLAWFETVGMLVKRGHLPLCEIVDVYKGPILNADIFFGGFIEVCQTRPHVVPGFYENALYLAKWVRWYEKFQLLRWAERTW